MQLYEGTGDLDSSLRSLDITIDNDESAITKIVGEHTLNLDFVKIIVNKTGQKKAYLL